MEIKQEFVSHKLSSVVEGRGGGALEKRRQELYRRWEKRGQEDGFLRCREAGEKGKN